MGKFTSKEEVLGRRLFCVEASNRDHSLLPTTRVHSCVLIWAPLLPKSFCATVWTMAYPVWPLKNPVPATTASALSFVELKDVRWPKTSYVVSTKSPGKSMMMVASMRYLMPPSRMYCPSNFPSGAELGSAVLVMTVSVTRIAPFCSFVRSPPGPATTMAVALGTRMESWTKNVTLWVLNALAPLIMHVSRRTAATVVVTPCFTCRPMIDIYNKIADRSFRGRWVRMSCKQKKVWRPSRKSKEGSLCKEVAVESSNGWCRDLCTGNRSCRFCTEEKISNKQLIARGEEEEE